MADQLITGTTLIEDKRTGTSNILAVNANNFVTDDFDEASQSWTRSGGALTADVNGMTFRCPINLPNGAIVTAAICWGTVTDESWTLSRYANDTGGAGEALASANLDTEDTTISNATINNNDYSYSISTSSLDATDTLHGGRITYTL